MKTKPVLTLAEEWAAYLKQCYNFPIPQEQERELRVAFYAGAMVAMQKPGEIRAQDISETEFQRQAEAFMMEAGAELNAQAETDRQRRRNN